MPTRRELMKVGAVGAGVLALGGVGLGLRGTVVVAPPQPLQALSPKAYSVLFAVAERICCYEGLPKASELGVAIGVDVLLASAHPGIAAELSQGLMVLESALTGLLLDARATPFSALPHEDQDAVLETWRLSKLPVKRTVYKAIHGLVVAGYWSDPTVFVGCGYPGPPDYGNVGLAGQLWSPEGEE